MSDIEWKTREEVPERDRKVIAFSPIYPVGHPTRFRILDGQFVRVCDEVEKWLYLEDIAPCQDEYVEAEYELALPRTLRS